MRHRKTLILLLSLFTLLWGCKKEENNDLYLVSHRLVRSYTQGNIQVAINIYSNLYPEISSIGESTAYDVKVYTIEYRTTFKGEEIVASGMVSLPDAKGSFPVISFQNGTNSCNSNAPSVNPSNSLYSLLAMMAGNGYIISIPDYLGFGSTSEMVHPYYQMESNNQVIRDMILAVQELSSNHLDADHNNSLYIMGYSQGGWATMSSLKDFETDPPGGMTTEAASCGAGAYELIGYTTGLLSMETFSNPFYFPFFIEGRISNGFMTDPLSLYFNEPYASLIPSLFDGTLCNAEINDQLTENISELFTPEILSGFSDDIEFETLRNELTDASVEPWNVQTPLLLVHSDGDESVPYSQTVDFITALVGAGTPGSRIQFIPLTGLLHNDAIVPWGIATIAWFNQLEDLK